MNELLKVIMSLSFSGSLFILILLLCKPLFKHKVSKRWQYYIWLVVLARLLLPFTPEVSPVGTLFMQVDRAIIQTDIISVPGQNTVPATQQGNDAAMGSDNIEKNETAPTTTTLSLQKLLSALLQNLWLIWLVIALVLFMRKITIYQSFVRYIKAGRKEVSNIALLDRLALLEEQVGVKKPVELFTNDLISSPLLIGFFQPCIVLPSDNLPDSDFQYTLLHELTHCKRLDIFYKWLVQLVICLHWFNPLAYIMGREIGRACELACDEAVIKGLNPQEQRIYGDTLLNAMGAGGSYKDNLASVTLSEGKELLKERLDAIMKFKKKSKLIVTITLMLTVTLCIGATALGAHAATPTTETSWSAMGGTGHPYTYSQQGYYQDEYIFELGWNLNAKSYDAYSDKAEVTLSDGAMISVSFDESCRSEVHNQEVLAGLKELIERLKTQYSNSSIPLEKPLVVSVEYVGDSDLVELAEEYYANDELTRFSAVFPSLDAAVQKEYCTQMIENGKTAFLSSSAKNMDSDMIDFCLEKTYQEGKTALFSGIVPCLTNDQKQTWIVRASRDGKNTFLSVLNQKSAHVQNSQNTSSSMPSLVPKTDYVKVSFTGISVTGQGPVGVELVRSQDSNVTFELLHLDNEKSCTTKADIVDGTMQITVNNNAPNGINVNFGPDYQNVVRVHIPNAIYTRFEIQSKEMVVRMQDFNAPVHVISNRAGFWLMDDIVWQGTYDIEVASGPIYIEADTILKNITANADSGPITIRFKKTPTNLYLDSTNCGPVVERPNDWPEIYKVGNETPKILLSNTGKAVIEILNQNH